MRKTIFKKFNKIREVGACKVFDFKKQNLKYDRTCHIYRDTIALN